ALFQNRRAVLGGIKKILSGLSENRASDKDLVVINEVVREIRSVKERTDDSLRINNAIPFVAIDKRLEESDQTIIKQGDDNEATSDPEVQEGASDAVPPDSPENEPEKLLPDLARVVKKNILTTYLNGRRAKILDGLEDDLSLTLHLLETAASPQDLKSIPGLRFKKLRNAKRMSQATEVFSIRLAKEKTPLRILFEWPDNESKPQHIRIFDPHARKT
ncbi:MAG: hypothetical protein V4691_05725, partial [Pseudomonadota bacterium]